MADTKTRVILEADDRTKKGVDSSISNLNKLSSTATSLGRTLGGIIGVGGGVAAALTAVVVKAANTNDAMLKAAQSVGTTTERLSELRYAGDLAGVSAEGIDKAVARAAKSAEDFRNNSKTAVDAFAKIGLDPTQFKDSADLFEAIIGKLSKMEDGTRKTAIAQEILGKAGKDLIPLINGGAEALAAAAKEAREFGLVIDTETAKQAEILNDNITRMQTSAEGLSLQLGNELIPTFVKTTEEMVKAIKEGNRLKAVLLGIGGIGRIPIDFFFPVEKIKADSASIVNELEFQIKILEGKMDTLRGTGGGLLNEIFAGGTLEELEQELLILNNQLEGFKKFGDQIDVNKNSGKNQKSEDTETKDTPIDIPSNSKSASDSAREELALLKETNSLVAQGVSLEDARTIARMSQKNVSHGIIVGLLNEQNLAKTMAEDEKKAEQERTEAIKLREEFIENNAKKRLEINTMLYDLDQEARKAQESVNQSIDEELDALMFEISIRELSTEQQQKQLSLRAAALEFEKAMYELNQAGVYLTEEETDALKRKYDEVARIKGELVQTNTAGKDLGLTFKSALEDAVVEGKNFSDVLKGIEQDIIRMLTRRMITKPLEKGIDILLDGMFSGFFNADGNAFNQSGLVPFAKGGIVDQPTPFTFANGGKFGVMGEAGPEAILPLSRGPNGKLGVQNFGGESGGSRIIVNVIGAPNQPEVSQRDDGNGNIHLDLIFNTIRSVIQQDIRTEGQVALTLQAQYGLNRSAGAR